MSRAAIPSLISQTSARIQFRELSVENGLKIRYQAVEFRSLEELSCFQRHSDEATLYSLARLFRMNILPAHPEIGTLVLFRNVGLPPFPANTERGYLIDPACRARYWIERLYLEGDLELSPEGLFCKRPEYRDYFETLRSRGMIQIIRQNDNPPRFLSVYPHMGLIRDGSEGRIVFNSHFFQMEFSDCETCWDSVGNPFGLLILGGEIRLPPMFGREALLVDADGRVSIQTRSIKDQPVMIGTEVYRPGQNCEFYARPDMAKTPAQPGIDLVIVGKRLLGCVAGGDTDIPEGGFVIHIPGSSPPDDFTLSYPNWRGERFAVQVGPAMIIGGEKSKGFHAPMYMNSGVPFPPTVYPLDWDHGRAARMAIGVRNRKPSVVWVAGPDKNSDLWERDSAGASLAEFAEICEDLGFDDAVNLDGGGSAQICLDGMRCFHVSDRDPISGDEAERPVPLALSVPFSIFSIRNSR
jgi:hypothetical protein